MSSPDAHPGASTVLMLSGLPGDMSHEIVKVAMRRKITVAETALSGPRAVCPKWLQATGEIAVEEGSQRLEIKIVTPDEPDAQRKALQEAKAKYGGSLTIVDFTHPSVVNSNADLYISMGIAFVMGTTGGDREALHAATVKSGVNAVIAPNLCKQLVALQEGLKTMASSFPGLFTGYKLEVTESLPESKGEASMQASEIVKSIEAMGATFDPETDMKKIRNAEESKAFGVPQEALKNHAFHTYTVKSTDGSAVFKFEHNLSNFTAIAEGAVDAALFLTSKLRSGATPAIYGVEDILGKTK